MNEPSVNYDVLSPVKFLTRSAEVYPEKVAVIYGPPHLPGVLRKSESLCRCTHEKKNRER